MPRKQDSFFVKVEKAETSPLFISLSLMSVEDATAMLWHKEPVPKPGFSIFKLSVLKELVASNHLTVGHSGKAGGPLKRDYVEAVSRHVGLVIVLRSLKY